MKLTDAEIEYTRQVAAEIGADPDALIAEGEQIKGEAYQGAYEASAEILGGAGGGGGQMIGSPDHPANWAEPELEAG